MGAGHNGPARRRHAQRLMPRARHVGGSASSGRSSQAAGRLRPRRCSPAVSTPAARIAEADVRNPFDQRTGRDRIEAYGVSDPVSRRVTGPRPSMPSARSACALKIASVGSVTASVPTARRLIPARTIRRAKAEAGTLAGADYQRTSRAPVDCRPRYAVGYRSTAWCSPPRGSRPSSYAPPRRGRTERRRWSRHGQARRRARRPGT
jgi:hypothetical protein